jgi:branched-chain amino acid transport system ATP-binding protein
MARAAGAQTVTPALRTAALSRHWGGFRANDAIDLSLAPGARHALIGPNGAGKTTLVNLLAGVHAPTSGRIYLGDEDITQLPQHRRVGLGLARTFQINTLFAGLTVMESVVLAVCERTGASRDWLRTVAGRKAEIAEAQALLAMLGLDADAGSVTRSLPYGRQRLVEIALALATRPKILLLDEPAAGIPGGESAALFEALSRLPADVTLLLIEHDMDLVFRFAERITVLVGGSVLMEGTPTEVAADARVKAVYLGEDAHA